MKTKLSIYKRLAKKTKKKASPSSVEEINITQFQINDASDSLEEKCRQRRPFKISFNKDQHSFFSDASKHQTLETNIATLLASSYSSKNHKIEASVSLDGNFSGHYSSHTIVNLSVQEFLEYSGNLNVYLAQVPIFQKKSTTQSEKQHEKIEIEKQNLTSLRNILEKQLNLPKCMEFLKKQMEIINVWWGRKPTTSKWHYDSYDNFLIVLRGVKKFKLLPPNSKLIKSGGALSKSYNQAYLISPEIRKKSPWKKKARNGESASQKGQILKVAVRENEILFVPQGWYHEVVSPEAETIAINFWYNSVSEVCAGREDYLLKYLLNQKANELASDYSKKYFESVSLAYGGIDADTLRTGFIEKVNKGEFESAIGIFIYLVKTLKGQKLVSFLTQKEQIEEQQFQNMLDMLSPLQIDIITSVLDDESAFEEVSSEQNKSQEYGHAIDQIVEALSLEKRKELWMEKKEGLRKHLLENYLKNDFL